MVVVGLGRFFSGPATDPAGEHLPMVPLGTIAYAGEPGLVSTLLSLPRGCWPLH